MRKPTWQEGGLLRTRHGAYCQGLLTQKGAEEDWLSRPLNCVVVSSSHMLGHRAETETLTAPVTCCSEKESFMFSQGQEHCWACGVKDGTYLTFILGVTVATCIYEIWECL